MSPGLAYSCFDLLELVGRRRLTPQELIIAFRSIGVMPAELVFSKCQTLRWIQVTDLGVIVLQAGGDRILSLQSHESRLRQALLDYVEIEAPVWLQNSIYGRRKVIEFAGLAIVQVLDEAGLLHSTDPDAVRFWDLLAARARGQKNDYLLSIGRDGERLSIEYERQRTGHTPKWIAIESNQDGYDLLSIVSAANSDPLLIEVKSTTVGSQGSLYLTRREWEVANGSLAHAFHLWDLRSTPKLLVMTSIELAPCVPQDQGTGKWQVALLPFAPHASGHQA